MRKKLRVFLFFCFAVCINSPAFAQSSPVGLWKTIDDDTGHEKSLVRITENRGVLEGRIEALLDPDDPADARCEQCTDDRHNQRLQGMLIIRGGRQADGKPGRWDGGEILDPENGKIYRLKLTLSPDGRKLDVRGYIGTPLFGRSQTWTRSN
jgi:uncharacterized protein (DUF2147 family)